MYKQWHKFIHITANDGCLKSLVIRLSIRKNLSRHGQTIPNNIRMGVIGIFNDPQASKIISIVQKVNENAGGMLGGVGNYRVSR